MKKDKKNNTKSGTNKVTKKEKSKPEKPVHKNKKDTERLIHLLEVHQIELEHQNEELRIAQEELEVSRNKYVNLFDFSPVPYFTLNPDGVIKEVNLSAAKMFGTERKKLLGRNLISYFPLDDKQLFNSFLKEIFKYDVKKSHELKIIAKDKQLLHVLAEGIKLENSIEPEQNCQVAIIDLTAYKKVEDELTKTNEKLKELVTTRDKFFSIIAHDLRSPFQSLFSSSRLLANEIESLSQEEIKQFSSAMNENLNTFFRLLENLLNWSMLQRDMLSVKPENLNLNKEINKIIEISKHNAIEKDISISNKIDSGVFVYADANLLRSIVQNLIMNAIKFTPKNGKITVTSTNRKKFVEISVSDTGKGISQAESSNLFDFGSKKSTRGTAGEKGTGLGLPLCKEFVEKNEGKIWVESEPGKGSKFIFTLPEAIN